MKLNEMKKITILAERLGIKTEAELQKFYQNEQQGNEKVLQTLARYTVEEIQATKQKPSQQERCL